MKNISLLTIVACVFAFNCAKATAAAPIYNPTVYTLMKCTSFNKKNGTLWVSLGHKVTSDDAAYFLTELAYVPPANDTLNVSLSWLDAEQPTMHVDLSENFLKLTFTATKEGRTQTHVLVAMGNASEPGDFKGNWSLTENGVSSDDLVTCTAR